MLLSSLYGAFTKKGHIWGHKTHFDKFKRVQIIQSMPSDHREIKLEINNRKTAED